MGIAIFGFFNSVIHVFYNYFIYETRKYSNYKKYYELRILKIASNNNNSKHIKDFTHYSKQRNSLCGDQIEITLKIKDNVIKDIGYQSKACIYCKLLLS